MTGLEIEAVYENGVLKLGRELPLENGQTVHLTIHPPGRIKRLLRPPAANLSAEDLDYLLGPENHPWATNDDVR